MTRHLADPTVGAVTALHQGGQPARQLLNRFVAFEYITAQAGARRAQNVLGAQACLAGGAQLIRRESLDAIGGEIDTSHAGRGHGHDASTSSSPASGSSSSRTRSSGRRSRATSRGLWKQRLRWGRGNVQVTLRFRRFWLRRERAGRSAASASR